MSNFIIFSYILDKSAYYEYNYTVHHSLFASYRGILYEKI